MSSQNSYSPPSHLVHTGGIPYDQMTTEDILFASMSLSNTGGRHAPITKPLGEHLSDFSLQRERVRVMILHLISLSELQPSIITLSDEEKTKLLLIAEQFSPEDYIAIFQYDHIGRNGRKPLEHDVKAVEYFLGEKMNENGVERLIPSIHMLCTSEDVNNIAYQVNLRNAVNDIILPKLRAIIQPLIELVDAHKSDAILGRTHGQVAVPTTFGKLIAVELNTLTTAIEPLMKLAFSGKFSGATGSNVDHNLTFPEIDWIEYEKDFVGKFGLRQNTVSDQRGQLMERVQLFQILQNINNVLLNLGGKFHDLCARGILVQKEVEGEVGSSVMPGKTNPWRIEEMEGLFNLANALFQVSIDNHIITRRERDLAEHPLERAYGEPMGQTSIGMTNFSEQLSRFLFSKKNANEELDQNPEIIGSGIQNVLRSKGVASAYTFLAKLMKGRNVTLADIHSFISLISAPLDKKANILNEATEAVRKMEGKLSESERNEFYQITLDDKTRDKLLALDPKTYIGDSPKRADLGARRLIETMGTIDTRVMFAMSRPRLLAVGWDFDDTLYLGDKEELRERVQYISTELKLNFSDAQIDSICKKARWDEQKSLIIQFAKQNEHDIDDMTIEQAQSEAKPKFSHLLRMDENAMDTLSLLKRKGIPQFLITNRGPKTLAEAFQRFNLATYFGDHVINASHSLKKPDPKLITESLAKLGVRATPEGVLYIGDHPELDVKFAQDAGVTPIHVNRKGGENLSGIVTVKDMSECFRYLSLKLL